MRPEQQTEIDKYERAYQDGDYGMGAERFGAICRLLTHVPLGYRTSLLDVATGRGEVIAEAERLGWATVRGTEVVSRLLEPPQIVYGLVWALPFADREFDTVTCFDVMEHLLPADAEPSVRELARVAARSVILTISNCSGTRGDDELHINKRPYDDWHQDLTTWLSGWCVLRHPNYSTSVSTCWVATR